MDALIEQILSRSGPFEDERARARHRHWLEGLRPARLQERLSALEESAGREGNPGLCCKLGLRYTR